MHTHTQTCVYVKNASISYDSFEQLYVDIPTSGLKRTFTISNGMGGASVSMPIAFNSYIADGSLSIQVVVNGVEHKLVYESIKYCAYTELGSCTIIIANNTGSTLRITDTSVIRISIQPISYECGRSSQSYTCGIDASAPMCNRIVMGIDPKR